MVGQDWAGSRVVLYFSATATSVGRSVCQSASLFLLGEGVDDDEPMTGRPEAGMHLAAPLAVWPA